MMTCFLAGLQHKIKHQIWPHDPKELKRVIETALDLEETTNLNRRGVQNY